MRLEQAIEEHICLMNEDSLDDGICHRGSYDLRSDEEIEEELE